MMSAIRKKQKNHFCNLQETQWEPPAAGFLPIPEEWLAAPAQETASDAATQADVDVQQTSHGTPAPGDIPELDREPKQLSPAVHLSTTPKHTTTDQQEAASDQSQGHHVVCDAIHGQQQSRRQLVLRPESRGLMSSIPEPQGTHVRFDNDTDAQQSCSAEDIHQVQPNTVAGQGHGWLRSALPTWTL